MTEYSRPPIIDPSADVFEARPGKPIFLIDGIVVKENQLLEHDSEGMVKHDYIPDGMWEARQALADKGVRLARYQYVVAESQRVPGMVGLYTVGEHIEGVPLEQALEAGDEAALHEADKLTCQLIEVLDDCIENGGALDIELIGYRQFMVEDETGQLVLVDLEPSFPALIAKKSGTLDAIDVGMVVAYLSECCHQVEVLKAAGLNNPVSGQRLTVIADKLLNHKLSPGDIERSVKQIYFDDEPVPSSLEALLKLNKSDRQ